MDMERFIHEMPKAELHLHIEGTLEPHMVRMLAERNNVALPEAFKATASNGSYAFHDLTSFLDVYLAATTVLQASQDFHDLTYAYLLKCKEQNVLHTEIFFNPQAHSSRGVPLKTVITGIRQGIIAAQEQFDISVAPIMSFLSNMGTESAMDTLTEALAYKEWIVGVGLDSDKEDNPQVKFRGVFQRAREEGFFITAHCNADEENAVQQIRECVGEIKVDRIDHGENIVEDESLIEAVKVKGIGLTCCPISNSFVAKDFKGKEIKSLLERGVRVTINSDDPAYFRAYVEENLMNMYQDASIEPAGLIRLQENAFNVSWISQTRRKELMNRLEEFTSLWANTIR